MKTRKRILLRAFAVIGTMTVLVVASSRIRGDCNIPDLPFTDLGTVPADLCASIAEAYFSGIMAGVSAGKFKPNGAVDRQTLADTASRTLDQSLNRGSRRAALNQWWTTTPHFDLGLGTTSVGSIPFDVQSDGADLWVASEGGSGTVSRVRASDGKLLETWTGALFAHCVVVAMGRVFVGATINPGRLYMIDPTQPAGDVTTVSTQLGNAAAAITFDGGRIWTANNGSVSIITPAATTPWPAATIAMDGGHQGIVFDGASVWVTETSNGGTIKKLAADGTVALTVKVGPEPKRPVFDGVNIWVPSGNGVTDVVTVVRASTGAVLATLTGNGLAFPTAAAFDGERILVINNFGPSVSLWKAADFTPLGSVAIGGNNNPLGVCSDGLNFWVTLSGSPATLGRF